jgi:predicted phosphodiesterase
MSAKVLAIVSVVLASACGPNLPPTTVPSQPDPTFEPFRRALQAYVDQTQPYRKQAAQAAESVPGKTEPASGAIASIRARENVLADALKTKLRPNAKPGDLFVPAVAEAIRHQVTEAFAGPRKELLMDGLAEQNEAGKAAPKQVAVNETTDAPKLPPQLIDVLPPLPKQLEYAFVGRTLLLKDTDAQVIVDLLPDTLPALAPQGVPTVGPSPIGGASAMLAVPQLRFGRVFALIGDSGSGDQAQQRVAEAMLAYFKTARRFPFVLMLGDNLYDDDYDGEFSQPYKPLLDAGVKFYAALGNHDRDLEIHFKPFNMNDQDHYSFDEGNARFAVLNSNHPADPNQLKWLDGVYTDAGDKWRIAYFHHPLYSSGQHAAESRDVIRPALESALVKNHVDVVFSGHEHLYERIAPQQGIRYFVSGGGGRSLYSVHRSDFDQVAISEHHFMIAEISGDRLFYEAITPAEKLLDCGVLWRRQPPSKPDKDVDTWLASCQTSRPRTTTSGSAR